MRFTRVREIRATCTRRSRRSRMHNTPCCDFISRKWPNDFEVSPHLGASYPPDRPDYRLRNFPPYFSRVCRVAGSDAKIIAQGERTRGPWCSRYLAIALDERNVTPEEQFGTLYSRHTFAASGSRVYLRAWQGCNLFSGLARKQPAGPGTRPSYVIGARPVIDCVTRTYGRTDSSRTR